MRTALQQALNKLPAISPFFLPTERILSWYVGIDNKRHATLEHLQSSELNLLALSP